MKTNTIHLLATLLLVMPSAAFANNNQELFFRVLLNDKDIGFHSFRVADQAGKQTVEINADFDVTFFAIPVYSYDHNNREVWNGGCLETIESRTDDNGDEFTVTGQADGKRFVVATQDDQFELDSGCVMTFAYWSRNFLEQSTLLNAQTGEYLPVDVKYKGTESLQLSDGEARAKRYQVQNLEREIDINVWYDDASDRWLSLESTVGGGRVIRYLPASQRDLSRRPNTAVIEK